MGSKLTVRHHQSLAANEDLLDAGAGVTEIDQNPVAELPDGCLLLTFANPNVVRPNGTSKLSPRRIKSLIEYMCAHLVDPITTDQLAVISCMSRFHFVRAFHATLGTTPHQYLIRLRMERARTLLTDTTLPIGKVARRVGYKSQSHFGARFHSLFGCTPTAYRKAIYNLPNNKCATLR